MLAPMGRDAKIEQEIAISPEMLKAGEIALERACEGAGIWPVPYSFLSAVRHVYIAMAQTSSGQASHASRATMATFPKKSKQEKPAEYKPVPFDEALKRVWAAKPVHKAAKKKKLI